MYMRACLSHTDLYVDIRERITFSNPAKVYIHIIVYFVQCSFINCINK